MRAAGELVSKSAAELAAAVRQREVGPVELLEATLERIRALNPRLNAIVVPDFERARTAARAAERALTTGERVGPLHGVPWTAKEALEAEGLPGREASRVVAPVVAAEDAVAVARIRAAGGILVGKTNISEFSSFPDSVNLVYGATPNPHDELRSAGGSSGGEACAVAACLSALGLGSDYGGSIRAPAHCCGVFGLRLGTDAVPLAGHLPHAPSPGRARWSTVGPLARTVADLELALEALTEVPVRRSRPASITVFVDALDRSVGPDCAGAVDAAAGALRAAGLEVREGVPTCQVELEAVFDAVTAYETKASLGAFLPERLDDVSPQVAAQWTAVSSLEPEAGALERLPGLERRARAWLEEHPVVLSPASAEPAFPLGSVEMAIFDLFAHCKYPSALGLPAVVCPVARTPAGLPVGVQLFARRGCEGELLYVAALLEEAFGGWLEPDLGA
jgi:amidase